MITRWPTPERRGGGPVDLHRLRINGTGDDVRLEAVAVGGVGDQDRLVGQQPAGFEQASGDRDAAVVVGIGVGDGGVVDFRSK